MRSKIPFLSPALLAALLLAAAGPDLVVRPRYNGRWVEKGFSVRFHVI